MRNKELGKENCLDEKHRGCLYRENRVTVKGQGAFSKPREFTRENWTEAIDIVRSVSPDQPVYKCVQLVGLCPDGLVSRQSYELLRLYNACAGISRLTRPEEVYSLPAIYVDAVNVIEMELARYAKK